MSASGGPDLITNNLVFHVDASNPRCYSGGSTCRDLTRINGDGILSNVSFSADKAFIMNSITSRVYFTRSFTNVINSATYIVTAEIPSNNNYPILFSSINANVGGVAIFTQPSSARLVSAYISDDSGNNFDQLDYDITANYPQKRVIACTINGTVFKLYVDGILRSTSSPHVGGNVNSQSLIELGYSLLALSNSSIYNRALTDSEVLQNYNSLKTRYKI
jgi:hypothetical protein